MPPNYQARHARLHYGMSKQFWLFLGLVFWYWNPMLWYVVIICDPHVPLSFWQQWWLDIHNSRLPFRFFQPNKYRQIFAPWPTRYQFIHGNPSRSKRSNKTIQIRLSFKVSIKTPAYFPCTSTTDGAASIQRQYCCSNSGHESATYGPCAGCCSAIRTSNYIKSGPYAARNHLRQWSDRRSTSPRWCSFHRGQDRQTQLSAIFWSNISEWNDHMA